MSSILEELEYNEATKLRYELRDTLVLLARTNFYTYVQLMAPVIIPGFIDGNHIKVVCDALQRAYDNENSRLMVFLPPGAMKSKLGSELYISWIFGREPTWQILHVGHGADFAAQFGGNVRDLMSTSEYLEIFPASRLNEKYQAREYWMTTMKGIYRAAGAGTAIAGKRGNFGICDDLISEQNADSKAEMQKIYNWWPRGFESRILPGGRIVMINTRWSTMDPAGWLLERSRGTVGLDEWEVVSIPAILDEPSSKLLNHPVGTSYWPEFYTTDRLLKLKHGMAKAHWLATYQQQPIALDGNIIKAEDFQNWENVNAEVTHVIASLDTAFSTSNQADYSVIQIWGIFPEKRVSSDGKEQQVGCAVLLSQKRGRWEYPDLVGHCEDTLDAYNPDVWIIEKKASGQSLIQDLRRRGYFVVDYLPDKDKVARAFAITPFIEDKRVYVPDKPWAEDFLNECKAFPKGEHDDTVDTFTQAVLWLRDSHYLNYSEEQTLEELEDERQARIHGKKFYW